MQTRNKNKFFLKMYFNRKTISNVQKEHLDKNLNILNAMYISYLIYITHLDRIQNWIQE